MAMENALVRLQNLRMEEQKSFQHERENYETLGPTFAPPAKKSEILRKTKFWARNSIGILEM